MAKCGRVHAIVRLAPEIIGLGVELDPVFLLRDLAAGEIVDVLDIAGEVRLLGVGQAAALAQGRGDVALAVFLDEAHQFGAVELVRVHTLQSLGAAPLPMLKPMQREAGRSAKSYVMLTPGRGRACLLNRSNASLPLSSPLISSATAG